MRTPTYILVAATCWLVLAVKLRALRASPDNTPLRAFCVMTGFIATTFTVGIPPLMWRVEHVTGLLAVWITGLVVAGAAAALTTLLVWTYPPQQAWPRIYRRWTLCGLALIVMAWLTVRGRVDPDTVDIAAHAQRPETLWAQTPYVADAVLIHLAILAYAAIDSTRMYRRYAAMADRRWLRRGLRITTVAQMNIVLYCMVMMTTILSGRFDVVPRPPDGSEYLAASMAILVGATGLTMPVWGPRLDRARDFRRLQPLWRALTRAAPEIVLEPAGQGLLGRGKFWDIDFRLYRRIIEIRDGTLALRGYRDEATRIHARQLAQASVLTGDQLLATVEAAVLTAAIHARSSDRVPARPAITDSPECQTFTDEIRWFTLVSDAFARTPGTQALMSHDFHLRTP